MSRPVRVAVVVLVVALSLALLASCLALGVRLSRDAAPATVTATTQATRTPTAARATPTRVPSRTPTAIPALPTATEVAITPESPTPTVNPAPAKSPTPTGVVTLVALDLSEAEVNAIVQKAIAGRSDVPVSGLYVALQPGLMIASGTVQVSILRVDLELLLTVAAEDGKAVPEIVDIRSGGRPLTGFLRDQVEAMITPYLSLWLQTESNVYVEEVVIEDGRLLMTGRYR